MNSIEIEKCLRKNKFTRKYFLGVFPCNLLPKEKIHKKPCILIVNTDPNNKEGRHWTSIWLTKRNTDFFDSSGKSFKQNKFFNQFILKNCNHTIVTYNGSQIQQNYSNVCGKYCCLFSLYRSKNYTYKKFLKLFNDSLYENDVKAAKLFEKYFV